MSLHKVSHEASHRHWHDVSGPKDTVDCKEFESAMPLQMTWAVQ